MYDIKKIVDRSEKTLKIYRRILLANDRIGFLERQIRDCETPHHINFMDHKWKYRCVKRMAFKIGLRSLLMNEFINLNKS